MNDDTVTARITPCLENGKAAFIDFMGEGFVIWLAPPAASELARRSWRFPVREPDPGRLAAFGAAAATAFGHMKSLDAESEALAQLRDALLPGLMSGEDPGPGGERIAGDAT